MDHVRANPDSGLKALPYAKSDRARRTALLLILIPVAAGYLLGWVAALVALFAVAPLLWKHEHHFFIGRRDSQAPPER